MQTEQRNHHRGNFSLFLSLGFVLGLVAAWFLWPDFNNTTHEAWNVLKTGDQAQISAWVKQFGIWGPLFIVLFMVLQMFLVVVNVVALIVVAVLAYGPVWGSLLALVGILTASTVGYGIGRYWGKRVVGRFIGQKTVAKLEEKVKRYGIWVVLVARISPFISNDAISFIAGTAGMPYWKFIAATVAGIVPLIVLIAFLGGDSQRLKTGLIWVSAVTIAAFLVYYYFDNRKVRSRTKVKPE